MRRLGTALTSGVLFFALGTCAAFAQDASGVNGPPDTLGPWKIANTLIFVVLFGYFIAKKAPAFFNTRSADIQKAIQEATGLKMQADLRYTEVDRKMATLGEEVRHMREQAAAEIEREHQRMMEDTRGSINRMHHSIEAEIAGLRYEGIRGIQQRTARAALDLAARRLGERVAPNESEESVRDFIHLVEQGKA